MLVFCCHDKRLREAVQREEGFSCAHGFSVCLAESLLSELVSTWGTVAERHGRSELVMKTRRQKRGGRKEGKEAGYRVYISRLYSQWALLLTSPHVQHFLICYEFIVDKSINYAWALWIWPLFSDLNPPAGNQTFNSWAFRTHFISKP